MGKIKSSEHNYFQWNIEAIIIIRILTRCSVVLQGDDVFGTSLQSFKERHDEVSDVFRVGRRERVFLALHGRQSETLTVHLARPAMQTYSDTVVFKVFLLPFSSYPH